MLVNGFEVAVDPAALADMEHAEEAARAHAAAMHAAMASAGGKATMASEHAPRIQSAGGIASMSGEHAPRISSLGGKAGLGKIRKKQDQTPAQAASAAYMRKRRAALRAAGAH